MQQNLRFTPKQLGILDAIDGYKPTPSAEPAVKTNADRIAYLDGYLKACNHHPDHAQAARWILRLYSAEQEEAEATAARLLDALWTVTRDESFDPDIDALTGKLAGDYTQ